MTSHPNRSKLPFHVVGPLGGSACATICRCSSSVAAQKIAQWWSEQHKAADVFEPGGLVGQYRHGLPSPEFQGRGDEVYPDGYKPHAKVR